MAGGLSDRGARFGGEAETWRMYAPLRGARDTFALGVKTIRVGFTRPFTWIPDAVIEADLMLRRTIIPLVVSAGIWQVGFGVLNFGEVAYALGVVDRAPGGVMVGDTREIATWISMMILAGVAGSALTADIGARKIRDELDALDVLGVDKFRELIVPRVFAMVYVALVLGLLGLLGSMVVYLLLFPAFHEISVSVYLENFYFNLQPVDLFATFVKHVALGFFIGLVSCQRGLATKGGAEGVGVAVTQTVVVTFFGIWALNSVFNIGLVTVFPDLLVLKG